MSSVTGDASRCRHCGRIGLGDHECNPSWDSSDEDNESRPATYSPQRNSPVVGIHVNDAHSCSFYACDNYEVTDDGGLIVYINNRVIAAYRNWDMFTVDYGRGVEND